MSRRLENIERIDTKYILPNGTFGGVDGRTASFTISSSGFLDLHEAQLDVKFVVRTRDGNAIVAEQGVALHSGTFSLTESLEVSCNGTSLYLANEVGRFQFMKALLLWNKGYVESVGTNEVFFVDSPSDGGMMKVPKASFAAKGLRLQRRPRKCRRSTLGVAKLC